MSTELPVIASKVGGVGRIIWNEKNGLLVSPADADELASAMLRLLRHPEEADKLAVDALATIAEKYSAKKMTDAYMELYTELIQ